MGICIQTYDILRKQLFRPTAALKSEYFKQHLLDNILRKKPYQLLGTKHDGSDSFDVYLDNDILPEYCFKDLTNGRKFWVEIEHRSRWLGGYPNQYVLSIAGKRLARYKKYDALRRMFLAITVGGENTYGNPLEFYLVPVRFINHGNVIYRKMLQYHVLRNVDSKVHDPESSLSSAALWARLNWKRTTHGKEIQQ